VFGRSLASRLDLPADRLSRLGIFVAIAVVQYAANALARAASEALFLAKAGAEAVPVYLILVGLTCVPVAGAMSRLIDRMPKTKLYRYSLVLAVAAAVPLLAVRALERVGRARRGVLRDPHLLPLGILQAATFGLAVIAGNWVVPLLERDGASSAVAGALGGLVLLAGIATRPLGGAVVHRWPGRRSFLVAVSLVAVTGGALMLAVRGPLWLSALGALALGLAAGFPFAVIFETVQRLRPDAPGAAVALVNGCAVLAILVGTPVAGLAFDLPGDGAAAFAAVGLLAVVALPFVARLPAPPAPQRPS
jgi:predicted MFS family arabinose efflux permease